MPAFLHAPKFIYSYRVNCITEHLAYFRISLPLDMVTGEAIIAIVPYRMQLNRKGSMWLKCFTITLATLMNSAEDAQMAIPKKEPRHFLLTSIEIIRIL